MVTHLKRYNLVSVSGRIDSYTAPKLAEGLAEINSARQFKIVIDLSKVDFLASAGMRVLIGVQKK
jgi:anti-sigma B factor antagonist